MRFLCVFALFFVCLLSAAQEPNSLEELLEQVRDGQEQSTKWSGGWSVRLDRLGCSLESRFRDATTYATNDPFRLFFEISDSPFTSANRTIPASTLFLWLQPQVWDRIADDQQDIAGVAIGNREFEVHRPYATSEWPNFYLSEDSARSVYDDLIAGNRVELSIRTAEDAVFVVAIPRGYFRTWSKMFEACHADRNH